MSTQEEALHTERAARLSKMARILKNIAHPTKLSILELLGEGKPLCVSDIQEKLGLEQSLLSHYLIKMKDHGILRSKRQGKRIYYELAEKNILKIFDCMDRCELG